MLGSQLLLPFVNLDDPNFLGGATYSLTFTSAMMGGNLKSLSVFSVGLSPWMSAMILWQMFTLSKKSNLGKLPIEIQDRRRMYLTLGIALIQSLAVSLNLPIEAGIPKGLAIVTNTLLLIAGAFFLVWLSDLNSFMGIGGSIVILMASMVANIPQQIVTSIQRLHVGLDFILLLVVMGVIFLYVSVTFQEARYRIPVNKIDIHNRFKQYSYLDIMLTPAGGMPFMYAISMVSIPQYVLLLLRMVLPKADWIPKWISSRFLNRLVMRFAVIGAVYTVLMAGGPMLVVLMDPQYLQLSMIPGMFLIFSGMVYNIREEVKALTLNESYKGLFE